MKAQYANRAFKYVGPGQKYVLPTRVAFSRGFPRLDFLDIFVRVRIGSGQIGTE
jgi:hypothetical protein